MRAAETDEPFSLHLYYSSLFNITVRWEMTSPEQEDKIMAASPPFFATGTPLKNVYLDIKAGEGRTAYLCVCLSVL